jgi:hypothetical protein
MRAIILERNKLVGRRLVRYFLSAGVEPIVIDDPVVLAESSADADLICADTFDGDVVRDALSKNPAAQGVLWTSEPLRRSLRHLAESPAINHVLGRRDFDSTPRPWELMMILRRAVDPAAGAPPLSAYLDWGYTGFEEQVGSSAERDRVVARVQDFVTALQVPKRLAEMMSELAHELLMNAMYDAPVDAAGRPKYAGDRRVQIVIASDERASLRLASDGTRVVLQVCDRYGGLVRRHVVDGLVRGLAGGEMDQSHGGAGLGMAVCHHNALAMFCDASPGKYTQVVAMIELDLNLREARTLARSLHLFAALGGP